MRVENGEEASRSTRQGNAEWLRGARVVGVLGLFYRPEGRMGEPEAVEFLLSDSQSLLLTCASDWTLHIGPGTWPRLPDWCVPMRPVGVRRPAAPAGTARRRLDGHPHGGAPGRAR